MYEAITVKDGRITGRHQSTVAITVETFVNSPRYTGHEVLPVPEGADYQDGYMMAEYTAEGTLRPLIDRVLEGLTPVPNGYELIDGELVQTQVPEEEAPPTLMARVMAAEAAAVNSRAEEAKATLVMFRMMAKSDTITPEDALDNAMMFPLWADCIGQRAEAGSYWRHGDKLYRVNAGQGHTIQADWPPDKAASLFSLAADPAEEWPEWIQPTGAHNAYAVGDKVTHDGKRWISTADNNTWMPGKYGWEEAA